MNFATNLRGIGPLANRSAAIIDREIDEELDFHIECRTRDLIESGMSPAEAAAEANRQFGAREKIRQQCRAINYGGQRWLLIGLCATILISIGTVAWMASLLKTAHQKNQEMLALISSLQPPPVDELDLVGEVKDHKGQPIADAKILLIYKSWPGGIYQQLDYETTTDDQGNFKFEKLYSADMQNAFLITVLADGWTMQSEYVICKAKEKAKAFQFNLKPAVEKTLIVYSENGQPLTDTIIYPVMRRPKQGSEMHLIYEQSAKSAARQTDSAGKVRMPLFAVGDSVQLMCADRKIDFVVDDQPEQNVGSPDGTPVDAGIRGTVATDSGQPVKDAKVLLIHKTWPGGRYQQEAAETTTGADGSFAFADCNETDSQEAFLISIVHEGSVFESQYVLKKPGQRAKPFTFSLASADKKTFLFKDASGQVLKNKTVALSSRTDAQSQEHLIYGMSQGSVSFKTDKEGKVALNFFKSGDQVKLSVVAGNDTQEVEFVVNDESEQTVELNDSETALEPKMWAPPSVPVVEEHVSWLRDNAIPFQLGDADSKFDDLQPLKALIGNARIVQLGEQSHGDGSCFEAKIRLIKFLHQEMGFDVLAFESGLYDCWRADQDFQNYRQAKKASEATNGAPESSPLEMARRGVFGIWTGCKQLSPLWDYLAEHSADKPRLELAGFDCQFTATASRDYFIDELSAVMKKFKVELSSERRDEFVTELRRLIHKEPFEGSKKGWLETLDQVASLLEKAKASSSAESQELLIWKQQLRSLRAYVDYATAEAKAQPVITEKSLNARDAQMAENLIWLAEKRFPDRKIIVWAASFHIMRNAAEIEVPSKIVDYTNIVPMGHLVDQHFGDRVFTVGFTAGGGQAGIWFQPTFDLDSPPEGTLEDLCIRAGLEHAFIPLKPSSTRALPRWLSEKVHARPLGYAWLKASWSRHFDAIIFQREMKAAKGIQ